MARGDFFTEEDLLRLSNESTGIKVPDTGYEDTPTAETVAPESESPSGNFAPIDYGKGLGKSAGKTILGSGTLGRTIQGGVSNLGERLFGNSNPFKMGNEGIFDTGSEQRLKVEEALQPDNTGEKIGSFVGDIAQFAIPSSYASKATLGAGLARRMLAQGLVGSGVQALKTGDIGKDEVAVGALNALSVPIGDVVSKGVGSLSTHFPEWLVRPLVKQSPKAKLKGPDAAKLLVESGNIGTVDDLIRQSDDAMSTLNTQIDDIISAQTNSGVTVRRGDIVSQIVDDINSGGGAIDETEILSTLDRLAPQARGLLQKDTLTLQEANQLRKLLDRTLGDRSFLANQLTFDKGILMDFANTLRETVKSSDDTLRPLYDEYSKNITLKQALNARAVAGGGGDSIGMYDLLTGGATFTTTGDPVTSLLAVAGRRAFETAPVKTGLAQVFKNTDKVSSALETASPTIRGAVLEFVSSLLENKPNKEQ